MQEKQVPRRVVICGRDPEQTSHQWQLFQKADRPCLLGKCSPPLLKASSLHISRKKISFATNQGS